MIYLHVRQFHHVSRKIWTLSRVSPCQTHHIHSETKQPLYQQRFRIVLPFHFPGLAPVIDHRGQAAHIDDRGDYAYEQRFKRTFGFYHERAAVQANQDHHWYHITSNGSPAYASVWQWCGNYQSNRCPVRDFHGHYYHIDLQGTRISGPHSYAGDFREGTAVVRSSIDGLFRAIDEQGDLLHRSTTKNAFLDLDVYHKGLARARDEHGWFYIDRHGCDTGHGRRYRQIENFYNGQALVQLLNEGSRCVINEEHQIVTRLSSCDRENRADLEQISKAYWPSLALKMGLDQEQSLIQSDRDEDPLRKHLRQVWLDFGLLKFDEIQKKYLHTEKGRLVFDTNNITRDRLRYWLQDRFLSRWSTTSHLSDYDIFADIADQPQLVALTHRVLNSYAVEDWQGIADVLPDDLLQASVIVDLGGGLGSLLTELSKSLSEHQRLICLDRPEVIALNQSSSRIEFQSADLFSGPLPSGDYYLLSRILHDWSDEKAKLILERIPSESLCIIDREVDSSVNRHSLLSLHMYLLHRAQERTRDEWNHLFDQTGWHVHSQKSFSGHTVMLLKRKKTYLSSPLSVSSSVAAVRRVVLPIAGLGTRMCPQTDVLPKILLPIIQTNKAGRWICRPAWNLLLEEIFAEGTGLEELICIINPDQYRRFHTYLLKSTLKKIKFILQTEPKGFGHAILLAENHLHDEPFVVMLGDHLYRSDDSESSCLQQLLDTYRNHNLNQSMIGLTGVMTCSEEEISQTGLLQSNQDVENKRCFVITDMAEKPSIDAAKRRFQLNQYPDRYLCQAGIDILPPTIFRQLREDDQERNQSTELGLRDAMNSLRQQGQLRGCLLNGQRYDIGHPKEYYRTLNAFIHPLRTTELKNHSFNHRTIRSHLQNDDRIRQFFSSSSSSSSSEPIFSASAPGRLDVMGGFADYSGAHVLQYPIAQRTYAFVQKSTDHQIRLMSIQRDDLRSDTGSVIWTREMPIELIHQCRDSQSLRDRLDQFYRGSSITDETVSWPSYIIGVIFSLLKKHNSIDVPSGWNIVIVSDIPCNKGLASSAALEVSVAHAVGACLRLNENLPSTDFALLCQKVENEVVGSPCGFMDQMTCVHGRDDHLFSLLCQQTPRPPFHHIPFPPHLQLFAIDSGVKRSTSGIAYQRVRQAAFLGKQLLNLPNGIDHLCQIPLSTFNQKYRPLLPENNGYPIRAATSHPIEENFRVQLFETLLSTNTVTNYLGELMYQSDAGYRSCGLHHEETSLLIDLLRQQSLSSNDLIGAKITGGGGGGTVAVLARRSPQTIDTIKQIVHRYETLTRRQTRIFSGSSSGLCIYPRDSDCNDEK